MDNASVHRGDDVFSVFRDRNFVSLYVPPYSPWFNPIEGCFSIVKRRYPISQDIRASFNSLTTSHFAAFFEQSLTAYGVDDHDAEKNRIEMDRTEPLEEVSSPPKRTRMAVVSTNTTDTVAVHRRMEGDVNIITRTRTVQTTIRRMKA